MRSVGTADLAALRDEGLPIGWRWSDLGVVAQVNPPRTNPESEETEVSFLAMGDVSEDGRIRNIQTRRYSDVAKGFTSFIDGDVLVAKITPCFENGKGALVSGLMNGLGFGSTEFHVVRARHELALPAFLHLHTRTEPFRTLGERSMVGSAGQKRVPADFLRAYPIALPPVLEQERIAAILTAVDDKLDVIARQIEATQTLKQGLMQTLFSRGVGTRSSDGTWAPHTQLHHVDGRELPRAWGAATLGAYIAELRAGVSVNAEDRGRRPGEVGVLKVSSVQGGRFLPSNHKTVVPMEVGRVAEPVQEGCIIISRANTPALVGESAYVVESCPELFLPDKLWQTRPTKKAHSTRWLAFYLQSPAVRQEVQKAATGTSGSMKNISKASLLSIFMPLVPLEEQRHIANLLGAVTSKIEALEAKHQHYQTLKRGLMQKLLTGEWRVKVDADMAA